MQLGKARAVWPSSANLSPGSPVSAMMVYRCWEAQRETKDVPAQSAGAALRGLQASGHGDPHRPDWQQRHAPSAGGAGAHCARSPHSPGSPASLQTVLGWGTGSLAAHCNPSLKAEGAAGGMEAQRALTAGRVVGSQSRSGASICCDLNEPLTRILLFWKL